MCSLALPHQQNLVTNTLLSLSSWLFFSLSLSLSSLQVDANSGIVGSTTGSNYYVRILSTLDRELLKPSASVALHRHSNALVDILPPEADSSISLMQSHEKPDVSYAVRPYTGDQVANRYD